jgi:hypothetical protein
MKTMELGVSSTIFWSRSTMELLELGVFGGENLEWSCFLDLELRGALPNTLLVRVVTYFPVKGKRKVVRSA